jgi:transposase
VLHTAGALRVPANLALVAPPRYSPQLNVVERLWLYLRQHFWSNRVYEDVDAAKAAAMAGCLDPEKVQSICRYEYLDACE